MLLQSCLQQPGPWELENWFEVLLQPGLQQPGPLRSEVSDYFPVYTNAGAWIAQSLYRLGYRLNGRGVRGSILCRDKIHLSSP
jgi:hypothetical protein